MKDNTKRKAPSVRIPSRGKPFEFFRESDRMKGHPLAPVKKRLSK